MPPTSTTSFADIFGLDSLSTLVHLGNQPPAVIVVALIHAALGFLGIIFLFMIIWSGLLLLFSLGEEEKTKRAWRSLWHALVGVAIILGALSITRFIFFALTGGKITL